MFWIWEPRFIEVAARNHKESNEIHSQACGNLKLILFPLIVKMKQNIIRKMRSLVLFTAVL